MSAQSPAGKSSYFVRNVTSKSTSPASPSKSLAAPTNVLNIPGTKTSLQNSSLLTPIGIPSIDSFIGGGLAVGSVCLIGQDKHNSYTDFIARCYVAEGVLHKHAIYVADLSDDLDSLKKRIPNMNKTETDTDSVKVSGSDELRIAWRYGQQQQQQQPQSPKSGEQAKLLQPNYFVMNKFMSEEEVSNMKGFEWSNHESNNNNNDGNSIYVKLGNEISSQIDSLNMNVNKTKKYTNILRIMINSIGGLVWNDKSTLNEDYAVSLCRFLLFVRVLLRRSLSTCLITVPNELVLNKDLFERLSHLVDYAFVMDDSTISASRLTKTEYDGLFRIVKLPRLNSLTQCFMPETLDLAFFVKRKRLVVEQLHLPPDLGENDDAQKGRTGTSVTMSCSSSVSSTSSTAKLDF